MRKDLEKILEMSNELLAENPNRNLDDVLHKSSQSVLARNSYYGNLLLNLNYIYYVDGRFTKNGKKIPSPHEAAAQYIAKKILVSKDRFIKSIYLDDDFCSPFAVGRALTYLANVHHALKLYKASHAYHMYTLHDREKLERIAKGNFT